MSKNCKYALPLIEKETGKFYRCCTILGEKCTKKAVYINDEFMGNICNSYDKDICKDKKVRE